MDFTELVDIASAIVTAGTTVGLSYWGLKHGLVELVKDAYSYVKTKLD